MGERRPTCTILGGPNGSGKSSIFEALSPLGTFVNADAEAKLIEPANPESASFAAGRQVLRKLSALIGDRTSFVYETTLSGHQPLDVMRRAKMAGYEIGLVFVVLASVDLNVERVAQRVARGGHDIPELIIRRRHDKALAKLGVAVSLADETVVLDNTGLEPQVLLRLATTGVHENGLRRGEPLHDLIASALAGML